MHADPAMWVAGITSLYLQALHPRAVAGVVQNSNFQEDPLGRLARTANFVGLSTYGPTGQVAEAAAKVRSIHRSLRATDQFTGRDLPDRRPGAAALGALRRGVLVPGGGADGRVPVDRRPVRPVPGRTAADRDPGRTARRGHPGQPGPDARVLRGHAPGARAHAGQRDRLPLPAPAAAELSAGAGQAGLHHVARAPGVLVAAELGHRACTITTPTAGTARSRCCGPCARPRSACRKWLRWGKPEPYALEAIARLGSWATPSVRRLPKI